MNRTVLFLVADVVSAPSPLLVDCAVKSTALLALAAIAAMILRRDSAATRHLVWLLAMVAMLVVPVLSAMLPEWQVLPKWAGIPPETAVVATSPPSIARPAVTGELPGNAEPEEVELPSTSAFQPAAVLPDPRPAVTPQAIPAPAVGSWSGNWQIALPLAWAFGCCMLFLRLTAARCMLWNTERRGTVIVSPSQPALGRSPKATQDPFITALEAACLQLGMRRPVTLMIHPDKTIPVVWGILRCRLLLPAAARHWSGEQLQSVLLHELAHIKRHDTLAQLLAQIVCALYWFNPLVWFAAWRLDVERERACDDLVLASGVRPSAYAAHLLDVVTACSPARWTQSCGLAMVRQSSLEGRLVAVLSEKQSRRGVSVGLATVALAMTLAIAVPIAMLRAGDKEPDAPVQQSEAPKPKDDSKGDGPVLKQEPQRAAKLQPGTEEKLQWGEPVNGLRMALAWPPALGEPAAGEVADFYVAIQNASRAPVRLCITADSPDERWLDLKDQKKILLRLRSKEPTGADMTLQPHEAVFLRLFSEAAAQPDAVFLGPGLASDMRQSPNYRLKAAFKVAKAPEGAWTGMLDTPETRAGVGAEAPKNRKAQELFKVWLNRARLSGKIPGGFIARLGEHVQTFVKSNAADAAGAPYAKRMEPLLSRLDGKRDWQPVDAASLLNDIAAVSDAPLIVMLEEIAGGKVQHGLPFKSELEKLPWGEPVGHGIGLRTATLIGPGIESKLQYVDWIGNVVTVGRAASDKEGVDAGGSEVRLGTPLGCRILIRNTGQEPVIFRTRTWHHIEPTAKDAKGAEIGMESITRYTRAPLVTFRLEPGCYIELAGPGFGLGKRGFHDFKNADIASWIGAREGDDVTLAPGLLPLHDWNEVEVLDGEPRWWLDFITARLNLVAPLPADPAERRDLLNKAMSDLFRQDIRPTEAETAAFLRDTSPEALTNLAMRLHHRTDLRVWAGPLQSGPTKFRVLAADPNAPKPPEGPADEAPPASPAPADKPAAAPASEKPKGGGKLNPGTEQSLKWSNPVNGLRAAVVIRSAPAEPEVGVEQEIYLAVQNVSDGPIRFSDTTAAKELRSVLLSHDDVPQSITVIDEPTQTDVTLQPRAVEFLRMYPSSSKGSSKRTRGALMATILMKNAHQNVVATLQIKEAPAGAWTGKLTTGQTTGTDAAGQPEPTGKEAQSLFKVWQYSARADGKIPGGALGSLARAGANFVKFNPTDERAPKIAELLKRIDMSRDWTPAEAAALLDEVTAIYTSLPSWAEDEPRFTLGGAIQTGQPLPAELKNAPWGEAQPNGLRVAWLLDPSAEQHRLGTPLKSRILFHNAGKNVVLFRALTWNQSGAHKARDAKGAEINITATEWTTIPRIVACRLAAGEFLEVTAAGIGVGTNKEVENRREIRVGAWVEAKVGDEVTFTPAPVSATGNFTDERAKGEPGWWLDFIKDRLSLDSPLPADAAERGRLLNRAVRDLFGTAPTPGETAAFVADRTPDAFDALAKRLAERTGTSSFTGKLQSGKTKFRVLPVDPDAAKKP
jgi:beta-lactamase regulating signal transducer with metallopeptidase domain